MSRRPTSIHTPALLRLLAPSPAAESPPRLHSEVDAWALRAAASNGFGGELLPASVRPPHGARRRPLAEHEWFRLHSGTRSPVL